MPTRATSSFTMQSTPTVYTAEFDVFLYNMFVQPTALVPYLADYRRTVMCLQRDCNSIPEAL